MTWLLLGLLLGVVACGYFGFERQRQVYEQLVRVLERDRDSAVAEMKVYRGLLFPVIQKAESAVSEGAASPRAGLTPRPPQAQPAAPSEKVPLARRRVPFRTMFNEARKLTNTPQQKTDALAAALSQQKINTEKKENVSA